MKGIQKKQKKKKTEYAYQKTKKLSVRTQSFSKTAVDETSVFKLQKIATIQPEAINTVSDVDTGHM